MAKITIDGIEVEVEDGINVIEAAKAADIHVPHFCYHPSLTVVGQCRMCLVEVDGVPKLQVGCATPVRDGMKVFVHNDKVDKARKGQMEFLLINHPLDCPICDKSGECPLQDYAFNYGSVTSRYAEFKRTYPGMDRTAIGPHVLQNMNRCIHCTRCIRFTEEISETGELAFFKRGAETEVGVFPGRPLDNWMSANVTDICPTGALTTREFRFEARAWNLDAASLVCNGCDVGCNMHIEHKGGRIFRYKPRVNPEVNDHWLCDYGRFSHERYETERFVVPKQRRDDYLGISSWTEVWEELVSKLRQAEKVALIASAQLTNEEARLAKRLFGDLLAGSTGVHVDPIGPIRMKNKNGWLEGTQAGPNLRGIVANGIEDTDLPNRLLERGASGIDVLWITDPEFSERASDPAAVEKLRQARFLVVQAWGPHPLANAADLVIPGAIFAEKSGTFTNLQNRTQRIHQAYLPKGDAMADWDVFQRLGRRLFPTDDEFDVDEPWETFERMVASNDAFADASWEASAPPSTLPAPADPSSEEARA